jgi:23S rRNA (uracil1939-C5)-methyltransferase
VRRPVSPPSAAEPRDVRIERVGADGDGVATLPDGGRLYVPLSLPGERVRVRPVARRGDTRLAILDDVLEPAADRAVPPCAHFGACGGCVLQHWQEPAWRAWKQDLLRHALQRAGFDEPRIAPLQVTPPRRRRRMDLAARRTPQGVVLGLHRRALPGAPAAAVCDLAECHVLHPGLFALLAPLRPLLTRLQAFRREASVVANLLDTGADLLVRTDGVLAPADRQALVAFAGAHDLPRLSWARGGGEPEPVLIRRPPLSAACVAAEAGPATGPGADSGDRTGEASPDQAGAASRDKAGAASGDQAGADSGDRTGAASRDRTGAAGCGIVAAPAQAAPAKAPAAPAKAPAAPVMLHPPPGGFLQPSAEGAAAIVQAVLDGLPPRPGPRARIAELYAGSGSLTFALAQRARVAAWEGDAAAAAALRTAANQAGLAGRVSVAQRDLARQPVMAAELAGFAAVVLDPPFVGAAAQTAQIAAARTPCVVYVSCNPAALARDARLLHEAGYRLRSATPIDQFLWSARLESVCVFTR